MKGRVTEKSGAGIGSVMVNVTHEKTGQRHVACTDSKGAYRFVGIDPGVYTVRFELPGREAVTREAVKVNGGKVLNVVLQTQ